MIKLHNSANIFTNTYAIFLRFVASSSTALRISVYMAEAVETKGSASGTNTELIGSAEVPGLM